MTPLHKAAKQALEALDRETSGQGDERSVWAMLDLRAALKQEEEANLWGLHSCSYYCLRHECVKAQRDSLRDKMLFSGGSDPLLAGGGKKTGPVSEPPTPQPYYIPPEEGYEVDASGRFIG